MQDKQSQVSHMRTWRKASVPSSSSCITLLVWLRLQSASHTAYKSSMPLNECKGWSPRHSKALRRNVAQKIKISVAKEQTLPVEGRMQVTPQFSFLELPLTVLIKLSTFLMNHRQSHVLEMLPQIHSMLDRYIRLDR